jgi:hypothetical protein
MTPQNRRETGGQLVPLFPPCSEASPADGRFQPGRSGNPGGRPAGLAALVRAETAIGGVEGAELVAFMLSVLRGKRKAPLRLRMEAAAWLADRGFGKVPVPLEHGNAGGQPLRFTLVLAAAAGAEEAGVDGVTEAGDGDA